MKKKIVMSLAVLLMIGVGAFYALQGGHVEIGIPAQSAESASQTEVATSQETIEELTAASVSQAQEIEVLQQQVEELQTSSASAVPPAVTVPEIAPPIVVPVSKVETPAASAPPTKKENAGTVFEGYTVTVTDKTTPAVLSGGIDWPITKLYFFSKNSEYLGSISGVAYKAIMDKYKVIGDGGSVDAPGSNGDWEYWFAERFNDYRGISGGVDSAGNTQGTEDTVSSNDRDVSIDSSSMAAEAFELINSERTDAGLGEVARDSAMMDLAQMRAEELAEKYDHVRPNGTRISLEYRYAEINNRRADTAEIAVSSWMDSSGHKDIILAEKYNYAGIGCYQGSDRTVYWCMLFSK